MLVQVRDKTQIRHFHVVVVQGRQRNVQKSVLQMQIVVLLFKPICFFDVIAAVVSLDVKFPNILITQTTQPMIWMMCARETTPPEKLLLFSNSAVGSVTVPSIWDRDAHNAAIIWTEIFVSYQFLKDPAELPYKVTGILVGIFKLQSGQVKRTSPPQDFITVSSLHPCISNELPAQFSRILCNCL